MNELSLTEWAALGEILATVGVVISIVFLAYEVNRNSGILQATNDNLLYELLGAVSSEVIGSSELASVIVKLEKDQELSDVESTRYTFYLLRLIDLWEMAFDRHSQGLLADDKWASWDRSLEVESLSKPLGLPIKLWEQHQDSYGAEFVQHVDEAFSRH